jgi:predicted enzyme related to lactoylglutathione lyase
MAVSISLDCNDLAAQTQFWAAALRYEVLHRSELHVALGRPDRSDVHLYLNLVPEPKAGKNRMHLDWEVDDMEAEARRLEELGATRDHRGEIPGFSQWITLQDPEGNELCVEQLTRD